MSEKLDKLRASLEKERERRIKINTRIESLERRIQEAEAAEVNEMVRTAKVTPEQLAALLRQSATSTPTPAALSAVGATFNKEESDNEDNHSQKALSCRYNMDTNRVEARFEDETVLSIDCIAIEDEYGNTPAQRAELDWLLYNKPLEYAQLVLGGEIEHYLSLSCDHGRLED